MRCVNQIRMCFALAVVTAAVSAPLFSAEAGLTVKKADLTVTVVGRFAEQKLILTVENTTETEKQEYITLPLPEEGVVLGYSIEDAQGQEEEAVCVPDVPLAANERNSSASLKSAGNIPNGVSVPVTVASHGVRRIVLHYAEPLKESDQGEFICRPYCDFGGQGVPLSIQWQLPLLPAAHQSNGETTPFTQQGAFYVGNEVLSEEQRHQGNCLILPKSLPAECIEMADGVFYASLCPHSPAPRNVDLPSPETLSLVWDASASMPTEGSSAAIKFLREYLKHAPDVKQVNLAVLRHRVEKVTNFSVAEDGGKALTEYLASLKCDGATSDLAEAVKALNPQDVCFIYSDGISNFGAMNSFVPPCRVIVLLPEESAGGLTPTLARLNAEVICLKRGSTKEQVNTMCLLPWRIARIKLDGNDWFGAVYDPLKDPCATSFEIMGTLPPGKHDVEIEWASGETRQTSQYEILTDTASNGILLRARYAHLLARRTLLETSPLLRQSALKSLSCLYKTAVPGYRFLLPSINKSSSDTPYADVKKTAERWRTLRSGIPPMRWLKRTAQNMVKHGMEALSYQEETSGVATGKMPEWLKEDGENTRPKGEAGKKLPARKDAKTAPKKNLVPWNPNASFLTTLQAAKDPLAVYEKLRNENLRCPAFYAESSYFFATRGEKEKALSVISNLCELAPDDLTLQASLAMRLMFMGEYDLSESCLLNILEKREDAKQAYWMWALLEERRGNTENAAEILVRLLRFPDIDEGLADAALVSLNRLRIQSEEKKTPLKEGLIPQEWIIPIGADLRMELLWDSFDSDVDLKVRDPAGNECDPEHPETFVGGIHSPDTTLGLGIESFTMPKAQAGEYTVAANIYGPVNQKRFLPVTLYLLIYFNYAKDGENCSAHVFRLEQSNGTADLGTSVLGGEFRNSSETE